MSQLTDRLERDLREIAARAHPSPSAWESIAARRDDGDPEVELVLAPTPDRSKRRAWITAAAAAFVVIAGSIGVLTRVGDDHATSTADPNPTTTFVSPRNGFSIDYSDRGDVTVIPATDLWVPSGEDDDRVDVVETGSGAIFTGASTSLPGEGFPLGPWDSIDDYVDAFASPRGCGVPRSQQAEVTIDGQSGRIAACQERIEATVVSGGRLYGFTLRHDRSDARAVFDAFAATIDLTPETAVDIPGLTTTFVSPTNGYSFGYVDRGGLAPATELWDPVNQPLDPINPDGSDETGFDGVETGSGAYFLAASTPIPEGVSIDEWVDQYASPRGYCVPRSQQAEITIDGQSGRISECAAHTEAGVGRIEATVVAGGRLYLFTLLHQRSDARAFFDTWVATIDLTPETAAVP